MKGERFNGIVYKGSASAWRDSVASGMVLVLVMGTSSEEY